MPRSHNRLIIAPSLPSVQYYNDLVSSTRPTGGLKPGLPWNMYSGLEHIIKDPLAVIGTRGMNSVSPSSEASSPSGSNLSTASRYDARPTAPPPPTYRSPVYHSADIGGRGQRSPRPNWNVR